MHFLATVLVPSDAPITEDAVAAVLAPYEERWEGGDDEAIKHGFWDWWVIGGRWTGAWAPGYDPTTDPANREECFLCHGTGKRDDELGRVTRERNPDYGCNGCESTGQRLKAASQWRACALDQRPAAEVVVLDPTFTLVTPDGVWHRQTWNGTRHVEDVDWPATYRRELAKHAGMRAVLVDYHS